MQETGESQNIDRDTSSSSKANLVVGVIVLGLFVGFLVWFLAFKVEWGSGSSLPLGTTLKGKTLIVSIEKINRVSEIRTRASTGDASHVLIAPTDPNNELVTLQFNVWNDEASVVFLNMKGDAIEVRGSLPDDRFTMIDISAVDSENVQLIAGPLPAQDDRYKEGFLTGVIELPQGNGLLGGWTVFEVPKGMEVTKVRWGAGGDVIFFES